MLRKIAGALLLIGLCLPYSCDVRPITGVWGNPGSIVAAGIPLVALILWCLDALIGLARRMRPESVRAARRALVIVFIAVTGALLYMVLDSRPMQAAIGLGSVAIAAAFLNLLARRGDRSGRIAPWLLAIAGVSEAAFLSSELPRNLQPGGWILAAGFALAIAAEWRETPGLPTREGAG